MVTVRGLQRHGVLLADLWPAGCRCGEGPAAGQTGGPEAEEKDFRVFPAIGSSRQLIRLGVLRLAG
jgi:hypothetical protein